MEGERKNDRGAKGNKRGRRGGGRERYVEWTPSLWGADHPAAANKGRPGLGVLGEGSPSCRDAPAALQPPLGPGKPYGRSGNVNHSPSCQTFLFIPGKKSRYSLNFSFFP